MTVEITWQDCKKTKNDSKKFNPDLAITFRATTSQLQRWLETRFFGRTSERNTAGGSTGQALGICAHSMQTRPVQMLHKWVFGVGIELPAAVSQIPAAARVTSADEVITKGQMVHMKSGNKNRHYFEDNIQFYMSYNFITCI